MVTDVRFTMINTIGVSTVSDRESLLREVSYGLATPDSSDAMQAVELVYASAVNGETRWIVGVYTATCLAWHCGPFTIAEARELISDVLAVEAANFP